MAAVKAEEAAVAAVKTAEDQIKDAEAEVKIINDAKAKNVKLVADAKAANEAAKQIQTKATADLAALKAAVAKDTVRPLAVAFSADSQTLAASCSNGAVRVWALASGQPVEQFPGAAVTTAASIVAADSAFVSCAADGSAARVDLASRWVLERAHWR